MHTAAEYVNAVLAQEGDSRPVLCNGVLDQPTDAMILGHNPGLKSPPLRPFWDGKACDKDAWMSAWSPGPARTQMEAKLLPCLDGLRVIECNLSHYRSKAYTDLPAARRVTDVFQILIEILRPKLVVAFGSKARSFFDANPDHLGTFVPRVIRGVPVQVFLGNHVIMGGARFWRDGGYSALTEGAQEICSDRSAVARNRGAVPPNERLPRQIKRNASVTTRRGASAGVAQGGPSTSTSRSDRKTVDEEKVLEILRRCPSSKKFQTSGGRGGPYSVKVRDSGRGPAVEFIRATGGSKTVSIKRLREFWRLWKSGKRELRHYQNQSGKRTKAAAASYVLPVFEWIDGQV